MKGLESVESVSDLAGTRLLTFVLSVIAGSVDVIGFLGLGTLFIAHITGNLVILTARYAAGEHTSAAHIFAPFQLLGGLDRGWLRGRSERRANDSCCHVRRFRDGRTKCSCATLTQGCAVHCGDDDQLDQVCTGSW
jgi:hypothetical protein